MSKPEFTSKGLRNRTIIAATDFAPLVTAGYCAGADLDHPIAGKGWVWNGTTRKFEPERP
jgi:hypothetical protein